MPTDTLYDIIDLCSVWVLADLYELNLPMVKRARPKRMTVTAAFMGLMPSMWSTGAGSDTMKREAAPMGRPRLLLPSGIAGISGNLFPLEVAPGGKTRRSAGAVCGKLRRFLDVPKSGSQRSRS